jgi:hypothetical protein
MPNQYINEFLRLKCAPELIEWKLFPNAKEITESIGCYNAVLHYIVEKESELNVPIKLNDPTINLVSVGDGSTPRTAALFAMRSNWRCYSVDPNANNKDYSHIKRLTIIKKRIEDCGDMLHFTSPCIIVCVHSHAKLDAILNKISAPVLHLVTIPCCIPHNLYNRPYIGYRDRGIRSEKNEVKIWLNVNGRHDIMKDKGDTA